MNRAPLRAGFLGCCLILAGCGTAGSDRNPGVTTLPPCTAEGTMFAGQSLDALPNIYHGTVARVVDAHLDSLTTAASTPLLCTAEGYRSLIPATSALGGLASQLPEWRGKSVFETDIGPVLLEHLRTYECALVERSAFLGLFVLDEKGQRSSVDGAVRQMLPRGDLTLEEARQLEKIREELNTSRKALNYTISMLGGLDRLQPLTADIECLKRASLDLRNVLGLTAQATACMPKIWDARGSLRDLPEKNPLVPVP